MRGLLILLIVLLIGVLTLPVAEFLIKTNGEDLLSIQETPRTIEHVDQLKGGDPFITIEPTTTINEENIIITSCLYLEGEGHLICGIVQRPFGDNPYSFLPYDGKISMSASSIYMHQLRSYNFFDIELPYSLNIYNDGELVEVIELSLN